MKGKEPKLPAVRSIAWLDDWRGFMSGGNQCPQCSADASRSEGMNNQENACNERRNATNKRRRRPCDGENDAGPFLLLEEVG